MSNLNKYEIKQNEVHETLNKPIHNFINAGNALITFILLLFILLFNWVKVDQHNEQDCFLRVNSSASADTTAHVLIIMQKPFYSYFDRWGIYTVNVNGKVIEVKIDSITEKERVINCRLPLTFLRNIHRQSMTNGFFATLKERKESITFFQIFYRKLVHL